MTLALAIYGAVLSTILGLVKCNEWWRQRFGAQLRVSARMHDLYPERVSHIELDFQATAHRTSIGAIYLAGYKSWGKWLLGSDPDEMVPTDWNRSFPVQVEPGHGWEGLLAVNDKERAQAARYPHVRLTVRFTGLGRTVSKSVAQMLHR
jgi:hypothetical protein